MPRDGALAGSDWTGLLEGDALPAEADPPGGAVVSANQRLVPEGYGGFISREDPPEHRALRIHELLRDVPPGGFTAEGFAALQPDVLSLAAERVVPPLLAAGPFEGRAAEAASLLAAWDLSMDGGRLEPLVYSAWHRAVAAHLFAEAVDADALGRFLAPKPRLLEGMLSGDVPGCPGGPGGCRALVRDALDEALAWIAERQGEEIARWRWRGEKRASHLHPVVGSFPLVWRLFGIRRPHEGGPFTVMQMKRDWNDEGDPFAGVHGPGVRLVHDLGEPARSRAVLSGGQAGNPLSRWYRDQADAWFEGRLLVLEADPGRIVPAATLSLVPGEATP